MTWRTVVISGHAHLSFKNNYVVVRKENVSQIHISEIHTLIIDSTMTTISTSLMNELIKAKVKLIICDEKHNPAMELMPYYGAFDSSRMIMQQCMWENDISGELWKTIVQHKIKYQARVLEEQGNDAYLKLKEYIREVELHDVTNREGHAAKVYFNALFGKDFARSQETNLNAYLNYGYTILLSTINKEVVKCGYLTQLGIHHIGPTNPFNLSCDLIEPFRPIIDEMALAYDQEEFGNDEKMELVGVLNQQFIYQNKTQYLSNIISIYVSKVLSNLTEGVVDESLFVYERIKT